MIFLTGGTGFIGSKIVEELSKKDEKMFLLTRHEINLPYPNITPVIAKLMEIEKYKEYLKNSKVLIHIAGCARAFSKNKGEFYETNYLATKLLIEEALKYNLKKIIYFSTCMVFGPSSSELCEEDFRERNNFFTDYERSKYLAEIYVRRKIKEGAPIIVLYPTRVFGPGKLTQGNSLTKLIYFFMRHNCFPVIENVDYIGNYVYIYDVVEILLKSIYTLDPPQMLLVGGYNLTFKQFFETLNETLGANGKIFVIRKKIALLIAKIFEIMEIEANIPALISRGWIQTFTSNWSFSNKKIKNILNYSFTPFDVALKNTIKWLEKGKNA